MRKPTWGPVVKERVRCFLEALLFHADELYDVDDFQFRWEDSARPKLVVETKRRCLERLTNLKRDQIYEVTESLKTLAILEDNRAQTQGKEEWHFTLKLWSKDTGINLNQFDREWENKRPEKSKAQGAALAKATGIEQRTQSHLKISVQPQALIPSDSKPKVEEMISNNLYVERPPIESQCYEAILQPGALIRIKAPQQMGKTWLMEKLLDKVASEGYRTISLSLKLADSRTHFTNLDKFLRWFCTNVGRQLRLASQLDDYWDEEGIGSKVSCTTYFEEYLLKQADTPLTLCLDDVDWVFPYPEIYEDFFALLRSWHEKARSRKIWKRLRLVVIHSTETYIRLNIDESPFNVGLPIELSEFSQQQVQDLALLHGLDWNSAQVEQLMIMVGGLPSLVQQALTHLKTNRDSTLEKLLETVAKESGIYGNHLRTQLLNLQQHPTLASALKKVVTTTKSVQLEPMQAYKLHSMGLVKLQGNEVTPRCNLYKQYFCERLKDT